MLESVIWRIINSSVVVTHDKIVVIKNIWRLITRARVTEKSFEIHLLQ